MVLGNIATTKRYLAVFDEAIICNDGFEIGTCDRLPDANNPHKHYTAFQIEIDDDGTLRSFVPTPGLHQKEVEVICKEASEHGSTVHLEDAVADRISADSDNYWVTLKRETVGATPPKLFVDVVGENSFFRSVGAYTDDVDGYKIARRRMLQVAGDLNITHEDRVGEEILAGK